MNHGSAWNDEKTERLIGNLLRAGVIASALIVLAGGVLYLVHEGRARPDYGTFRGQPAYLTSVSGVVSATLKLDSNGLMQLGLMLLVLTPIARVVLSAYAFFREGDNTYVVVSLIVLAILIYSLMGSG